jgi:hypothetical protein
VLSPHIGRERRANSRDARANGEGLANCGGWLDMRDNACYRFWRRCAVTSGVGDVFDVLAVASGVVFVGLLDGE